jgi:magnesium-transporting ATPase (P-type)
MKQTRQRWLTVATIATTVSLILGSLLGLFSKALGNACWYVAVAVGLIICMQSLYGSVRERRLGVDAIALVALAAAVAINELFAAGVLSVMLATGALLEARAAHRARQDLSILASRAPTFARRLCGAEVAQVPTSEVVLGDELVLALGDVVPVDGALLSPGVFDESALTGEATPVQHELGDSIASGIIALSSGVRMRATGTAENSTYATIVKITRQAQATSAPFVRMADRWALILIPATLGLAGFAWLIGDVDRAVSVLVIATPCPLIWAAPIAVLSGIARAARQGVIVKGGAALERLAKARVLLLDKTGTLTEGRPRVTAVRSRNATESDVLQLAGSLEQYSTHVLAPTVVKASLERQLPLLTPTELSESQGHGISGLIDSHLIQVGSYSWLIGNDHHPEVEQWRQQAEQEAASQVFISKSGNIIGCLFLQDPLRPRLKETLARLRSHGLKRTVLITGDHLQVSHHVAQLAGVDVVHCDVKPEQKLDIVKAERRFGPTMMIGDGINDAPALAGADVGVALAARGATAASQAADVVLVHERIDALADALDTAHRSMRIAGQSVFIGMGLSALGMGIAVLGGITPASGALMQEGIDLVAILWALRATQEPPHLQKSPQAPQTRQKLNA